MKSSKKFLVVAVAGALTAATAVPALALENEFHGAFSAFYDLSNYTAVGNDTFEPTTKNATGLQKNSPTENYFVQRARLNYNAKASDNVKLVTKFELDYSFWGNSAYTTGRNTGGAMGADSVQIETKNLYLDLDYPQMGAKIGMQPFADSFKGILFDADVAGLLLSHNYKNASVDAGYFRLRDGGPEQGSFAALGHSSNSLYAVDGKYKLNKDLAVGASYYYFATNDFNVAVTGNENRVHTVGLNAEGTLGPVSLDGFLVKQFGRFHQIAAGNTDASGYAGNVGAKVAVGGGTARMQFLYVSGGSDAFFVPQSQAGSEGAALYDAELIMLHRDKNAKTLDTAIIYDVNNFDQGLILGSLGFDYTFTDKLSASANAGFAAAAHRTAASVPTTGDSKYFGTELNLESNYKLTQNVTLGVRGGYVILGDYFKGLHADNPYDMKIIASYVF